MIPFLILYVVYVMFVVGFMIVQWNYRTTWQSYFAIFLVSLCFPVIIAMKLAAWCFEGTFDSEDDDDVIPETSESQSVSGR